MARIELNAERCKGCELCTTVCPGQVLSPGSSINSKGYHPVSILKPESCTGCASCALVCPDLALAVWR